MSALLGLAGIIGLAPVGTVGSAAIASTGGSAVTIQGTGEFAGLAVTVAQTRNLVNQVVSVSWSGGKPTQPSGAFSLDYLQIMQCWGYDAAGPDRTQCEFGGRATFETRGGDYTRTRQANYSPLFDPNEPLVPPGSTGSVFVPFKSVTGKTISDNTNEFFDANTTNEIPFGRTKGDGTGEEFFEVQTQREAPGLGCGQILAGEPAPRKCWLVMVPRGIHEVDGSVRDTSNSNQLISSPLSTTNWAHRLVVPLDFAPVGNVCPIGSSERRTVGLESIAEAVTRWQPALCTGGGPVYGYAEVPDSVARRQLLGTQPGMVFMSTPVDPAQVPPTKRLVYAPISLSGLSLSFVVESQSAANAPAAIKVHDGERLTSLNLTPRLVAKLLTQSYRLAVDGDAGYLKDNPADMTKDPEFLAINPAFRQLSFTRGIPDIITPAGLSDANKQLWEWVGTDAEARNFLAGAPDKWGMRINPFYQGQSTSREDFPKQDPYCRKVVGAPTRLCALDAHPYVSDFHEGSRAVGRADSLGRTAWDPLAVPPAFKRLTPIPGGQNALIALTDTATSARYGLTPARLRNASGVFVAPTTSSLTAAYQSMGPSGVVGVIKPNPLSRVRSAYPLPTVSYAVTIPALLDARSAKDYANLVRFAIGKGQQPGTDPGQLPDGYVPLPRSLKALAAIKATDIENRVTAVVPSTTGNSPGTGSGSGGGGQSSGGGGSPGSSGGSTGGSTTTGVTNPTQPGSAPKPAAPGSSPTDASGPRALTPADLVGAARYTVAFALLLGALAAGLVPVMRRKGDALRPMKHVAVQHN